MVSDKIRMSAYGVKNKTQKNRKNRVFGKDSMKVHEVVEPSTTPDRNLGMIICKGKRNHEMVSPLRKGISTRK